MARAARHLLAGYCFHVLNRGNERRSVFLSEQDYEDFLARTGGATDHVPMRILGFCLMPPITSIWSFSHPVPNP